MKKYEFIAKTLRDNISSGKYKCGQSLPTENILQTEFDVSRQTVRKALSILVDEGLITKRQGSGSVVARIPFKKSINIAIIATYISDYIFPIQLREAEAVFSENNCSVMLTATRNRVLNESKVLNELINKDIDAVLVEGTKTALPNPNLSLYKKLMNDNIPMVFFNGYYPSLAGTISVCADNRNGGKQLVDYLIEKGHTVIAGIFKSDDIQGHQRYSGYISALWEAGLHIPDNQVIWYTTEGLSHLFEDGDDLIKRIGNATAVVCYNDEVALKLVQFLQSIGKKVPQDIAIVSFDNSKLSDISPVPITSLSHGDKNIGRIAAQKLIDIISGKEVSSEIIPWILSEKESS